MLGSVLSSFVTFASLVLSSIGPFVLLLAVLIFIHELGHFLVARWCGVRVEVFSLGFGPKILKYKKGETIYCISALPFGGYVKMFGDNPFKPVPKEEQHKGFLYKKVPQKLAIAFGGPAMNLLFTFAAFWFLGVYGLPSSAPVLGDVPENSPAWAAGMRSGDRVLAIQGEPVAYWEEAAEKIKESAGQVLQMDFLSSSGREKSLAFTPKEKKSENPLALKKLVGHIEGLTFVSKGTQVGLSSQNSPAWAAGLRTFDTILTVNGKKVRYWRELEPLITAQKKILVFTVKRQEDSSKKPLDFLIPVQKTSPWSLKSLGLEWPSLYVSKVGKDTPAKNSGLKRGDKILSVQGVRMKNWKEFSNTIKNYRESNPLEISIRRYGEIKKFFMQPKKMITAGVAKETFMVGVVSTHLLPPEEKLKRLPLFAGFLFAGEKTFYWLKIITVNLIQLIKGDISYRHISGPLGIGRVAHQSFQEGLVAFLFAMALISLSLFYINLLPIPLLDGGHILFFSIEGLLRRPLDLKKLVLAQNIGLVTILSFFAFVFVNDIYNWLTAW